VILEIKIPASGSVDLSLQLVRQWPSYVSFVINFAFIGVMWINHHRLFTHIRKSDDALRILNLLLLLGVTSVPFPTAVMAHLRQAGERTAILLYNGTYLFIAICFNLLWRYLVAKTAPLVGQRRGSGSGRSIALLGNMPSAPCSILSALDWPM